MYTLSNLQANTLQVVLATDGTVSFVFFIYYDIQWAGFLGTQLGFGAGDGIHSLRLSEAFNTSAVLNLESTSNIDIPGHYLFRVDAMQIVQPKGVLYGGGGGGGERDLQGLELIENGSKFLNITKGHMDGASFYVFVGNFCGFGLAHGSCKTMCSLKTFICCV